MRFSITIIILLALLSSSGCGVPGAPLPPSADIPQFVGDLKAVRKGDTVTLTWTTPTETSDGELIRKPGKMLVQRALRSGPNSELAFQTISEVPLQPTLKDDRAQQATATDTFDESVAFRRRRFCRLHGPGARTQWKILRPAQPSIRAAGS